MIISRTPFRTSFIGGGTDLEAFCEHDDGAVISSSICRYIYVTVKRQLPINGYKYRISWNKLELKNTIEEIEHPIVREALKMLNIDFPVEITTFADIPSQTGLGSSSAFAVGLLNALYALKKERVSKNRLAREAAEIEIRRLNRKVGAQDHYASAYGNFNILRFHKNLRVTVEPVLYDKKIVTELENRLFLFYTSEQRDAGKILEVQSEATAEKNNTLKKMLEYITPMEEVLCGRRPLDDFGKILHEGWLLKRSITNLISTKLVDGMYDKALSCGATGGKLLGAGAGGFLLLYIPPEKQEIVKNALSDHHCLSVNFDYAGSRITYYDGFQS